MFVTQKLTPDHSTQMVTFQSCHGRKRAVRERERGVLQKREDMILLAKDFLIM
jgi:hypothetical protein